MANTWTFKRFEKLDGRKELARIIEFYLWRTPVPGASAKGRTFKDLGWKKGAFNTLQVHMREKTGFPNSTYWIQTTDDMSRT